MKENLQRVEKRKEKRGVIRRGTEIGRGTRIEIGIGGEARIKIERGTETGIGNEIGTETGIVIVIIETATGIVRGVSEGEIRKMMMRITTVAATMIGGEIMTETGRIGIGAGLVQGVDLSTNPDQGRVRAHVPKAKELAVLIWRLLLLHCYLVLLFL